MRRNARSFTSSSKVGQVGLVGGITTVLAPHIGMSATLIGPGVAAVLLMVGRVGLAT